LYYTKERLIQDMENNTLDAHTEELLKQYDEQLPIYEQMEKLAYDCLRHTLRKQGIYVTSIEHRIKERKSLQGKLELKGGKYTTINDVTDIVGLRVITFYSDDVDKVAAIVKRTFDIDWEKSVDKRKLHQMDSFGYNSLHYICNLPKTVIDDPEMPALNTIRFEIQMRTTLQHAWAAINHDTGYKSGIEIPREYMRRMNRLAGLLEMADDEFSRIRMEITDYRRRVQKLVQNGKLDDVLLDGDTFRSYLQIRPLESLNKRIAAINQAEIQEMPLIRYLRVLIALQCKTLGDVDRLIKQYSEDAYLLARHQLGNTDIDIISSAIGLQNICIVCVLSTGGGKIGLERFFDAINGHNTQNAALAELTYKQALNLPFMKQ
jgi:ppGpp synthetase/RelA/SpoT-type nucleotidyltranferase